MGYTQFEWNGQNYRIPNEEIKCNMEGLGQTKEEAIFQYLEDEGIIENAEQAQLQAKASKVKINLGARDEKKRKTSSKPRTVKVSDEKTQLFTALKDFLTENYNTEVMIENKLMKITINGIDFKLDLIQQRKKK